MALERRRRLAPVDAGRARQHAGAGVRRERHGSARPARAPSHRAVAAVPVRAGDATPRAEPRRLDASSLRPWRRPSTNAAPVAREHAERASSARRVAPRARPRAGAARRLAAAVRAPREEAPHDAEVERQVQRHQQHRAVAEQVVPVEHRQLLVGDPEDAEPRRGEHVGEQEHARADVERVARRGAAAQRLHRPRRQGEQQRRGDPQQLRHGACLARPSGQVSDGARPRGDAIRVPSVAAAPARSAGFERTWVARSCSATCTRAACKAYARRCEPVARAARSTGARVRARGDVLHLHPQCGVGSARRRPGARWCGGCAASPFRRELRLAATGAACADSRVSALTVSGATTSSGWTDDVARGRSGISAAGGEAYAARGAACAAVRAACRPAGCGCAAGALAGARSAAASDASAGVDRTRPVEHPRAAGEHEHAEQGQRNGHADIACGACAQHGIGRRLARRVGTGRRVRGGGLGRRSTSAQRRADPLPRRRRTRRGRHHRQRGRRRARCWPAAERGGGVSSPRRARRTESTSRGRSPGAIASIQSTVASKRPRHAARTPRRGWSRGPARGRRRRAPPTASAPGRSARSTASHRARRDPSTGLGASRCRSRIAPPARTAASGLRSGTASRCR